MAADYVVISSSPFTLNYSGAGEMDKSLEFTLPSGAKVDTDSILFWVAEMSFNVATASLTCRININTKQVYQQFFNGRSYGSYHAVIGATILKEAGKTNNIEFEIEGSGYSNLKVSDIYLMMQR